MTIIRGSYGELRRPDNFPKHRTLCEFRRRHLDDFRAVFAEVVRLARTLGLAGLATVSVDGTKVRANASRRKAMSCGRMGGAERRLQEEIEELLKRAEAVDEEEDARYGEDGDGNDLPEELRRREDRPAAIRAAKARLEAEQRAADDARGRKPGQTRNPKGGRPYKREYGEPDESAQSNFTDPESRIMKTSSEGFQQCCNAQMAVDGENQLVVGADVTDNASDQGRLIPMLDAVEETCGETPEQVPADASCCNEPDLQVLTGTSTGTWRWAGRARPPRSPMRTRIRRGRPWPRSCKVKRAGDGTHAGSGWRRRPSAGSRR